MGRRRERTGRTSRTALLLVLGLLALCPAQASAVEYGMSDGRPQLFDAPPLHELDFRRVRLVLPWNAGLRSGSWDLWLERAAARGLPVMVAMNIDEVGTCDGGSCTAPSVASYSAALAALLAAHPVIEAVEAWNEPNQGTQPTAGNAPLAARYFDAAYAACVNRCTAVAGNVLDSPSMGAWLARYVAALRTKPAVWGIHDYSDATYFGRSGLDRLAAATTGPIWITEVGGLVALSPSAGWLPYDEARAADSLRWMFSLVPQITRVQRMYLYGMWEEPALGFDSALLRADGSERESMRVVRKAIGPRPVELPGPPPVEEPPPVVLTPPAGPGTATGSAVRDVLRDGVLRPASQQAEPGDARAPAPGAAAAAAGGGAAVRGRLQLDGKRSLVFPSRRAALTVRCIGEARCSGQLQAVGPRWRYRRAVALAPGASARLKIRLPGAVVRTLGRRASRVTWARVCTDGVDCERQVRAGFALR